MSRLEQENTKLRNKLAIHKQLRQLLEKKIETVTKENDKLREKLTIHRRLQVLLESRNSEGQLQKTQRLSQKIDSEEVASLKKSNAVLKKENQILREQLQKYQAEKEQAKIETDRYKITNGDLIEKNRTSKRLIELLGEKR